MKGRRGICVRLLLWSLVFLLAAPPGGIMAQGQDSGGQTIFRQEELDQMLAPIALYPDELLVQVLMAATYPLEVVQAARWIEANPYLKGDQLAAALEQQDWDPSVKSLVNFPSVLQMMNARLDWMQMLGDAFLAQEEQVMDTVQQLRQRAQAQGSLRTTSEQTVIVDPQSQEIIIEPAAPQVVYVPVYDPMIVYGPWWWPAYRPYYYHPRGVVIRPGFISFGLGVAVGVAWGYAWGDFNWHHHDVVINVTRNVHVNNHIDRSRYVSHVTTGGAPQGTWRHDPVHRMGVAYRAPAVAQKYGRGPSPGADTRRDFRGYDQGGTGKVAQRPSGPAVQQQPRGAVGPGQARPEPPRQPSAPVQQQPQQQARPAPAPQVRQEAPRQPAGPVQEPRVSPSPPVVRPEPPRQPPAAPVQQQPQQQARPAPAPQPKVEPPRQPAGPVQEPRVAPSPPVVRPEPPRQPSAPVQQQPQQQARPAPAPQVRQEAPRQPSGPIQEPRVSPGPAVARPEPPRQPAAPPVQQPQQQPRPAPAPQVSPGRAGAQGVQGPAAFGGASPASQTRQFSNRGHESLGGAPAAGQAPSGNRATPRGESPGGAPKGGGGPGNPHDKR